MTGLNVGNNPIQTLSGFLDRTNDTAVDQRKCQNRNDNADCGSNDSGDECLRIAGTLHFYFLIDGLLDVGLHGQKLLLHGVSTGLHQVRHIRLCKFFHHIVAELFGNVISVYI